MTRGYKVFNPDFTCKGFQYEVGKTYEHTGDLGVCSSGFHFCEKLIDCYEYYSFQEENKIAEVIAHGKVLSDGKKSVTDKIEIVKEITWSECLNLVNHGKGNTGYLNTGDRNTGDRNTGNWNTGNGNTGHWNTGSQNTGDRNTGHWNTGDQNTGGFNKCNNSTGFFNTKERTVTIFNKDSGMTYDEFLNSKYYDALISVPFVLTEWHEFTEEEKKDSIIRQSIGGKLISYTYEEACANWWNLLSGKAKKTIQQIPNFDAKILKEITGIDVK